MYVLNDKCICYWHPLMRIREWQRIQSVLLDRAMFIVKPCQLQYSSFWWPPNVQRYGYDLCCLLRSWSWILSMLYLLLLVSVGPY